jgi:hypothetical protein
MPTCRRHFCGSCERSAAVRRELRISLTIGTIVRAHVRLIHVLMAFGLASPWARITSSFRAWFTCTGSFCLMLRLSERLRRFRLPFRQREPQSTGKPNNIRCRSACGRPFDSCLRQNAHLLSSDRGTFQARDDSSYPCFPVTRIWIANGAFTIAQRRAAHPHCYLWSTVASLRSFARADCITSGRRRG